jgi:hypothetical protein
VLKGELGEVDLPIEVETATWSKAGQLDWSVNGRNRGAAYGVQAAANGRPSC